jgi:hypothetical protein
VPTSRSPAATTSSTRPTARARSWRTTSTRSSTRCSPSRAVHSTEVGARAGGRYLDVIGHGSRRVDRDRERHADEQFALRAPALRRLALGRGERHEHSGSQRSHLWLGSRPDGCGGRHHRDGAHAVHPERQLHEAGRRRDRLKCCVRQARCTHASHRRARRLRAKPSVGVARTRPVRGIRPARAHGDRDQLAFR